jgi:four helix bundle protein
VQDFRDLKVWHKAHELTLHIYKLTHDFPSTERYGMTSQIRRAAVSIAANIAEGAVRSSDPEFARFLHIAIGSASEVDYYLLLSRDLEYVGTPDYNVLDTKVQDVKRMLNGLLSRVKANTNS